MNLTRSWIGAVCATAACLASSALAQWSPPQAAVIATGWKYQGVAMTRAWGFWGPAINLTQPNPLVAVGSSIDKTMSVSMPSQSGSQRIQSLSWQQEPILGTPRNILDAHCDIGLTAQGYAPMGSFMNTAYYSYNTGAPVAGPRRKVLWIYLRSGHLGSKLALQGGGQVLNNSEIVRINFGGRHVRVNTVPAAGGNPTFFSVTGGGLLGSPQNPSSTDINFGTVSTLNHFIMLEFPESETWGPGGIQVVMDGTSAMQNPGPTASSTRWVGVSTWLMWYTSPRVGGVPTMQPVQ